jgi:4-amino-4-deoxy-L-arabinose transferase-like glycosyltransferase
MLKLYPRRLWITMRRDPVLLALLVLAAAYFVLYYFTDPAKPGSVFPQGWFGFYDQGQYLREAHTLASLKLSQLHTTYSYGFGYPLVAVPFIWLGFDRDPFVFFNLAAFVFAIYAVYKTAKWLVSPFAGFLAGFGLLFATPLIHYADQPWNSTVCLVVMSAILLALTVKKVNKWHFLLLGILLGWAFAARYVDVIWLGVLALASLYRGSFKTLARQSVFMVIGLAMLVAPVMYSQYKIFGSPLRTPYVNHIGLGGAGGSDQGLAAYNVTRIPKAALALFVSPVLAGSKDNDRGLLIDMFWVLAAVPGAFVLFRGTNRKLFLSCFVVFGLLASLFYLSFRASTPGSLKYGELHYFKMWWPGMVILAAAFFDRLMRLTLKASSKTAATRKG